MSLTKTRPRPRFFLLEKECASSSFTLAAQFWLGVSVFGVADLGIMAIN